MTVVNLANNVGAPSPDNGTIDITKLSGDDLEMEFVFEQTSSQQGATTMLDVDGHYVFERR